MPDIHWGYGFPIGGVRATDPAEGGVVSPGGVGYDINCGVRLMRSDLFYQDVKPQLQRLIDQLFAKIPAGTGRGGKYRYNPKELRKLMAQGVGYLRDHDLATDGDVEHTEAGGCLADAVRSTSANGPWNAARTNAGRWDRQSLRGGASRRGDLRRAGGAVMGLEKDMVCVMVHSGSRGLGYQVCDDALKKLRGVPERYGIHLPDRQLACAPIDSPEGQHYLGAMCAAANFAWCNRQLLMWQARESFEAVFGRTWQQLRMNLMYEGA